MIDGIKIVRECLDYKVVFPEWAELACGITLVMSILFLAIGLICDSMNHDVTVPLWFLTVFLAATIVLLIVGGVLHDVVPDGVYWEVEIGDEVDWGRANALYDFWIETNDDGVHYYAKEKKPG